MVGGADSGDNVARALQGFPLRIAEDRGIGKAGDREFEIFEVHVLAPDGDKHHSGDLGSLFLF